MTNTLKLTPTKDSIETVGYIHSTHGIYHLDSLIIQSIALPDILHMKLTCTYLSFIIIAMFSGDRLKRL